MRVIGLAATAIAAFAAIALCSGCADPRSVPTSARATSGPTATTAIPPQYKAIAARYAPLTQHFTVDCGSQSVPVPMLAAPGGAERSAGPAADALRAFFRSNPWSDMGDVNPTNWLLLAESPTQAIFGRRIGPIGVGPVIAFSRHGSEFIPESEGGCSTVRTAPGVNSEPLAGVTAAGTMLTLRWTTGSNCGDGPARTDRVTDKVTVLETSTTVRVLLTSRPASDAGATHGACAGVGVQAIATAQLRAPLGHRQLLDDARIPSIRVTPNA